MSFVDCANGAILGSNRVASSMFFAPRRCVTADTVHVKLKLPHAASCHRCHRRLYLRSDRDRAGGQ